MTRFLYYGDKNIFVLADYCMDLFLTVFLENLMISFVHILIYQTIFS